MKLSTHLLLTFCIQLAGLSFLTFGGVNAVIPEMHRLVVEDTHWMTDHEFAAMFAIGQGAPGPNFLIVSLLGWHLWGLVGAIATTVALTGPACVLTFACIQVLERYRTATWRIVFQAAVVPVTVGFVASSGWIIARSVDSDLAMVGVTLATLVVCLRTKVNPLWMLGLGAVVGAAMAIAH